MANEKRLIDAKALMDAFRNHMVERYDRNKCTLEQNCKTCEKGCLWRRIVTAAPTVDAVEVVRCKDCIYNITGSCSFSEYVDPYSYNPNWFCADGERKDNG